MLEILYKTLRFGAAKTISKAKESIFNDFTDTVHYSGIKHCQRIFEIKISMRAVWGQISLVPAILLNL